MLGKQRQAHGSKNGHAKLVEHEIEIIRYLYSSGEYTQKRLAELFRVSPAMISYIVRRKNWKLI